MGRLLCCRVDLCICWSMLVGSTSLSLELIHSDKWGIGVLLNLYLNQSEDAKAVKTAMQLHMVVFFFYQISNL